MPARNPEDADIMVGQAVTAGDIEAALSLYEPGATFVPEPGQTVTGSDGIRQVLAGFIATKPQLAVKVDKVIQAGDLALLYSSWSLKGTGPDGGQLNLSGKGTEVVRQQADGTWRFVIDNPFGVA